MFEMPWKRREGDGPSPSVPPAEHPLSRLRDELDGLINRFFNRFPAPYEPGRGLEHFWGMDVAETDKEVIVRVEAPGFEATDFDVQLTGNALQIRAEHKPPELQKEGERPGEWHRRRLQRSITLPATGMDLDKVEARYRSGILEVRIPKTGPIPGKSIPIQT